MTSSTSSVPGPAGRCARSTPGSCGSRRAAGPGCWAAWAGARGATRVDVVRPLVAPAFGESAPIELPVHGPVALVVAGSWGVGEVAEAAAEIAATGLATPVTLCGHNAQLRRRIAAAGTGLALGWVSDMPALVRAADVVVQNAGGLTSLEAMAAGGPVISYRCLPGHGTTNAQALDRAGLAPWVTGPDGLAAALRAALSGGPPPAPPPPVAGAPAGGGPEGPRPLGGGP